ncbi:hypothetical protein Ciccas_006448 [Cichlidogyrus casuarinus]|uniref:Uncharacterized protein n=1 Tax=Cichlidogyrus casuarinus TaxID=1844966 RepID=A0ABD2Q5R2_9PLAT
MIDATSHLDASPKTVGKKLQVEFSKSVEIVDTESHDVKKSAPAIERNESIAQTDFMESSPKKVQVNFEKIVEKDDVVLQVGTLVSTRSTNTEIVETPIVLDVQSENVVRSAPEIARNDSTAQTDTKEFRPKKVQAVATVTTDSTSHFDAALVTFAKQLQTDIEKMVERNDVLVQVGTLMSTQATITDSMTDEFQSARRSAQALERKESMAQTEVVESRPKKLQVDRKAETIDMVVQVSTIHNTCTTMTEEAALDSYVQQFDAYTTAMIEDQTREFSRLPEIEVDRQVIVKSAVTPASLADVSIGSQLASQNMAVQSSPIVFDCSTEIHPEMHSEILMTTLSSVDLEARTRKETLNKKLQVSIQAASVGIQDRDISNKMVQASFKTAVVNNESVFKTPLEEVSTQILELPKMSEEFGTQAKRSESINKKMQVDLIVEGMTEMFDAFVQVEEETTSIVESYSQERQQFSAAPQMPQTIEKEVQCDAVAQKGKKVQVSPMTNDFSTYENLVSPVASKRIQYIPVTQESMVQSGTIMVSKSQDICDELRPYCVDSESYNQGHSQPKVVTHGKKLQVVINPQTCETACQYETEELAKGHYAQSQVQTDSGMGTITTQTMADLSVLEQSMSSYVTGTKGKKMQATGMRTETASIQADFGGTKNYKEAKSQTRDDACLDEAATQYEHVTDDESEMGPMPTIMPGPEVFDAYVQASSLDQQTMHSIEVTQMNTVQYSAPPSTSYSYQELMEMVRRMGSYKDSHVQADSPVTTEYKKPLYNKASQVYLSASSAVDSCSYFRQPVSDQAAQDIYTAPIDSSPRSYVVRGSTTTPSEQGSQNQAESYDVHVSVNLDALEPAPTRVIPTHDSDTKNKKVTSVKDTVGTQYEMAKAVDSHSTFVSAVKPDIKVMHSMCQIGTVMRNSDAQTVYSYEHLYPQTRVETQALTVPSPSKSVDSFNERIVETRGKKMQVGTALDSITNTAMQTDIQGGSRLLDTFSTMCQIGVMVVNTECQTMPTKGEDVAAKSLAKTESVSSMTQVGWLTKNQDAQTMMTPVMDSMSHIEESVAPTQRATAPHVLRSSENATVSTQVGPLMSNIAMSTEPTEQLHLMTQVASLTANKKLQVGNKGQMEVINSSNQYEAPLSDVKTQISPQLIHNNQQTSGTNLEEAKSKSQIDVCLQCGVLIKDGVMQTEQQEQRNKKLQVSLLSDSQQPLIEVQDSISVRQAPPVTVSYTMGSTVPTKTEQADVFVQVSGKKLEIGPHTMTQIAPKTNDASVEALLLPDFKDDTSTPINRVLPTANKKLQVSLLSDEPQQQKEMQSSNVQTAPLYISDVYIQTQPSKITDSHAARELPALVSRESSFESSDMR